MTFTRALPFQSTFPRGERRGPYLIFLSPCRFQSTFPRGERHLCWLVAVKHIHFNPRSLVGNDYIPVGTYTIVEISIHVPSWGTTIFTRRQPPCILFQSTFPRGERLKAQYGVGLSIAYFNPRSLVGNDSESAEELPVEDISIHVPSWGTTDTTSDLFTALQFQSTFPRGERRQIFTNILCFFMQ